MIQIEITGIRKDNGNHYNPHEAVTHYRWVQYGTGRGAISTRQEMVKLMESGVNTYVERVRPRAYCFVNTSRSGIKFLQTYPDATEENNLLRLPEV
jgi:hypothetical protein